MKECFGDKIKVGGYASCGFYAIDKDPEITGIGLDPTNSHEKYIKNFFTFLEYITSEEHKSPIDFFSWHSYGAVHRIIKQAEYCHKNLVKYGLGDIEEMLNEWNPCHTMENK